MSPLPHSEAEDRKKEAKASGTLRYPCFGGALAEGDGVDVAPGRYRPVPAVWAGAFGGLAALPRAPGSPWPWPTSWELQQQVGAGLGSASGQAPAEDGPARVLTFSSLEPRKGGHLVGEWLAVQEQGSLCPLLCRSPDPPGQAASAGPPGSAGREPSSREGSGQCGAPRLEGRGAGLEGRGRRRAGLEEGGAGGAGSPGGRAPGCGCWRRADARPEAGRPWGGPLLPSPCPCPGEPGRGGGLCRAALFIHWFAQCHLSHTGGWPRFWELSLGGGGGAVAYPEPVRFGGVALQGARREPERGVSYPSR